jgi:16S rRNA (guanine527-N7)-methyltransferase
VEFDSIWFLNVCRKNSFAIGDSQFDLLSSYVTELLERNKTINLISRRDEDTVWLRHVLASVSILFQFRFSPESSILDLGTGGGLPGIPIAILDPTLRVTLLDSITKKITAVRDILEEVKVDNVSTIMGRAEEIGRLPEHSHKFDYVLSRAVGPVVDLVKWGKLLLNHRTQPVDAPPSGREVIDPGTIVMMKGGNLDLELESARRKFPSVVFDLHPIVVDGIEPGSLPDKKIIFARVVAHDTPNYSL